MTFEEIPPGEREAETFMGWARLQSREMARRDPAQGDIVHLRQAAECVAAIVTEVEFSYDDDLRVRLTTFPPGVQPSPHPGWVSHDETIKAVGTWHWPEITQ